MTLGYKVIQSKIRATKLKSARIKKRDLGISCKQGEPSQHRQDSCREAKVWPSHTTEGSLRHWILKEWVNRSTTEKVKYEIQAMVGSVKRMYRKY